MYRRLGLLAACLVAAVVLLAGRPSDALAAPPHNDDFPNAAAYGAPPFRASFDSRFATKAGDDPAACAPYSNSVWYSFSAADHGRLVVNTFGSHFINTVLAVYTGTRGALTMVACNNDAQGYQSRAVFPAAAGTTYHVMVGAYSIETGGNLGGHLAVAVTQEDSTPPPDPQLTLTEDEPDQHAAGTTLFYNPAVGHAGTFSVEAAAADPESGIGRVAFPVVFGGDGANDAESPYAQTDTWTDAATAAGAKTVTATNRGGLTATAAFTVTPDRDRPTISVTTAANVTLSTGDAVRADAADALAGVARVEFRFCAGADAACAFDAATAIGTAERAPFEATWTNQPADGDYTLAARVTDHVGNTADAASVTVAVNNDATPPDGPTLTLTENEPHAHVDGATLFYNPTSGNAGVFTVTAQAIDAESGIARVAFPEVFGDDAATDRTRPYAQLYAWDDAATAAGARTVTAFNKVELSADGTFTVTPDAAAPTVAIAAPGDGATIREGRPVRATAADAGAGVAQVEFRFCPGTSCAFADGSAIGEADGTAPFATTWSGQPANGQYTLVARAIDRVGNAAVSAPVTVSVVNDATPPTKPVLTLAEAPDTANQVVKGTTIYYRPAAGQSGAFTVTAASGDPESGLARVAFPAVFGGDNIADPAAPYERTYTWTAGATAAGAKPVGATNGAGQTATGTFRLVRDVAPPTVALTRPLTESTVKNGQAVRADASDVVNGVAGAGIKQVVFQYCKGTTCSPIGAPDTTAPYSVVWTGQPKDGIYALRA